jgi:RNA polymerase sigma-70 factor (ECF subfamily)
MNTAGIVHAVAYDKLDDEGLVELARAGEQAAFRIITQRFNRRLYRVARGILGDDGEAEDVVQETYLRAFNHLAGFRGESRLATWLTRIAINEALGRKRKRRPMVDVDNLDVLEGQGEARVLIFPGARAGNPETDASRSEVRRLLERAVDALPEPFRIVFVMREIEELSVEETASHLQIRPETVKTRLHRARGLLREALEQQLGSVLRDTYSFDGERCARMTRTVLLRLGHAPKRG